MTGEQPVHPGTQKAFSKVTQQTSGWLHAQPGLFFSKMNVLYHYTYISVFKNVTTLIRETYWYAYRKTKNHCWYHVTQGSQWNIRLRSPEYSPLWPCDPTQQWPCEVREAGPWPGQDHHLWRQLDLVPNLSFPPTSCVNLSQVQNFSLPQFPSLWNGDDVACWLMTLVWRIKENYLKSKGLSNPQFVEIHAMCNVSRLAGCGNCGKK